MLMTQTDRYSSHFGISQSAIKDFLNKSPKKWYDIWINKQQDIDKNENGFVFGSLLDTLLFTPENLESKFCVMNEKLPSEAIESIIRCAYRRIKSQNNVDASNLPEDLSWDLEDYSQIILECANEYSTVKEGKEVKGWYNNLTQEVRIKKIKEQGDAYFQQLLQCNDRKIISNSMNFEAIASRDILYNHHLSKQYLTPTEGVELIFQLEIFANHILKDGKTLPVKAALDILKIDHQFKTLQIVDFKTTYNAHHFIKSIKQYGYALQLSFYDYLLRLWLNQPEQEKYKDYEILVPMNLVIDKYNIPYVYEYRWLDLQLEREGNFQYLFDLYQTRDHNSKVKPGWEAILEEIGWHYHSDQWEIPKELFENKKIQVNLLNS